MLNKLLSRKGGWIIAIAVAVVAFVALNSALSGVTGERLDLTQDKLFTLSDGTKHILKRIKTPVTLELYISQRLTKQVAQYGLYATRVRDMVKDFADASDGKITVVEEDPAPFSETEDKAVSAGVKGVPLDTGDERVYFGLVAREGKKTKAIPFFQPSREAFLEYDLARLIENLTRKHKPVIGILTDLPMFGGFDPRSPQKRWMILDMIEEGFKVRNIFDVQHDLTDDIDVLFMAHWTRPTEKDLYYVDQYLMRGGRALMMTDPYSEIAALYTVSGQPIARESLVNRLTKSWGVSVVPKKVIGDMALARMVNAGTADNVRPAPYLLWPSFRGDSINAEDPVTRDISRVNMGTAGSIVVDDNPNVKVEPLLRTSKRSTLFDSSMINPRQPNVIDFVEKFKPGGKRLLTAVRISGSVDSAFPNGPPKEKPKPKPAAKAGETKPGDAAKKDESAKPAAAKPDDKAKPADPPADPPAADKPADSKAEATPADAKSDAKAEKKEPKYPFLAHSKKPLNVILIADADMLQSQFWVNEQDFFGQRVAQPFANNGDMVMNALENLAGSGDLISLRSRGTAQRPFTRVQALRIAADEQYRAREEELAKRLQETQTKFDAAQQKAHAQAGGGGKAAPVLTPEQKKSLETELDKLRGDLLTIRKQLRDVQLKLREDIENLDTRLRFINIALVPALVGLFAIVLGIVRIRRRRASQT